MLGVGVRTSTKGTGDLPAVTVQRFWTNHVETCVGVITPNAWR